MDCPLGGVDRAQADTFMKRKTFATQESYTPHIMRKLLNAIKFLTALQPRATLAFKVLNCFC